MSNSEEPHAGKIIKRSITLSGHATSLSLEHAFWQALRRIAEERALSLRGLVGEIDKENEGSCNLSSAVRVFILENMITERDKDQSSEN